MPDPHFLQLAVNDEHRHFSIRCNRLAISRAGEYGGELYLVSGVGTSSAVKAFRATLHSSKMVGLQVTGFPDRPRQSTYVYRDKEGYNIATHFLGLDQWHVVAWTKDWRFMPSDSEEHLWSILKSDHFTTPLLRHWVAPLRVRLLEKGWLRPVECYRAQAAKLHIPQESKLDELVSEGVACGELTLEER